MSYVKRPFVKQAWGIIHERGMLHTNWMLGVGKEAFPGMSEFAGLFRTRKAAREMAKSLRTETFNIFTMRIMKITLAAKHNIDVYVPPRKKKPIVGSCLNGAYTS